MNLAIAFCIFASAGAANDGVVSAPSLNTVRLKAQACVRYGEVSLADVADIHGPRAAELSKIKIGYSPNAGTERKLIAALVDAKIGAAEFARNELRIEGAGTLLTVESVRLDSNEVGAKAVEALSARIGADAKVELSGQISELLAPLPAREEVDFDVVIPERELRGSLPVTVVAKNGAEVLAQTVVPVKITIMADVIVALAPVAKGDPADASRFALRRVDVTLARPQPIRDPLTLTGRIAGRSIQKDEIVTADDFALAPVYRKGERTTLVVQRGALRIEASIRVDADAVVGARVPITCIETEKSLLARVRADGTLELITQQEK